MGLTKLNYISIYQATINKVNGYFSISSFEFQKRPNLRKFSHISVFRFLENMVRMPS